MLLTLILIVLVIVLAASGGWWLFQQTPHKRWRDQVADLWRAVQLRLWQEQNDLQSLGLRKAAEEQAVCADGLRVLLCGISVHHLDAYSGIGPVTIAKLRDAGYEDLAALQDLAATVPGLGEKRLADITAAVQDLTRQVLSQFESGGFAGAAQLGSQLAALRREYEDSEACGRARLQAVKALAKQIEPLVTAARQITFGKYLHSLTGKSGLLPLPPMALPDLDSILQTAETQARAEVAARRQAPAAIPVAPSNGMVLALQGSARLDADLTGLVPAMPSAKKSFSNPASGGREPPVEATTGGSRPPLAGFENASKPQAAEPHHVVLEIDPLMDPTADLVRRQYHLLRERYDPEKLKPFGPDFVELAQAKHAAVLAAATALLAELGEPLEIAAPPAQPQVLRHNPDLDALFGV